MKPSFKAFMEGIIDYAGLFPPADLSLDTSLQNYSRYRRSGDAWMLGRFIIPSARLDELEPYRDKLFQKDDPYEFSVLGNGTETVDEFRNHLRELVEAIKQFHDSHSDRVITEILEMKLPREAVFVNDNDLLMDIYEETARQMNSSELLPNQVFFEGLFEESWKKEIGLILETMEEHNRSFESETLQEIGFKLRCGGVEPDMFPSLEQVAFTITKARGHNVPLKCTAGLHHPIRHYSDSVNTKMHGFFNVFGGAMLGYAHNLSQDDLIKIIKEEDPGHFHFTDGEFQWDDLAIGKHEIAELRDVALLSFGSCSFDEPREDLRNIGLLDSVE